VALKAPFGSSNFYPPRVRIRYNKREQIFPVFMSASLCWPLDPTTLQKTRRPGKQPPPPLPSRPLSQKNRNTPSLHPFFPHGKSRAHHLSTPPSKTPLHSKIPKLFDPSLQNFLPSLLDSLLKPYDNSIFQLRCIDPLHLFSLFPTGGIRLFILPAFF